MKNLLNKILNNKIINNNEKKYNLLKENFNKLIDKLSNLIRDYK